jgi:hypothetical protein
MNNEMKDEYDFEQMGDNYSLSSMVGWPWSGMNMCNN